MRELVRTATCNATLPVSFSDWHDAQKPRAVDDWLCAHDFGEHRARPPSIYAACCR